MTTNIPKQDDLIQKLLDILNELKLTPEQQTAVMTKLVPYLAERDHAIFDHAYNLGHTKHAPASTN